MELYLDTGNIEEIKSVIHTGQISGITTNPTLILKSHTSDLKTFKDILLEIISVMKEERDDFTLSAEVTHINSVEEIISQGRELASIDSHIIVKVPLTKEGLEAVKTLSYEGIRCNVTLCFSLTQAVLAAKAGAWCVSPFVGRIEDEGYSGINLLQQIKQTYDNYNFKTKILAASLRSVEHVHQAMLLGVDMATIPKSVFDKLYYNPLTDIGVKQFSKDWEEFENARK
ncbi:MAG: fructose-6-phosphate aldolase [Nanoarchaeota archaeon]|nr:fructose-6-phosphate aldolase [Nanoarchaeota archaeon]